jgi:hypothetical protein
MMAFAKLHACFHTYLTMSSPPAHFCAHPRVQALQRGDGGGPAHGMHASGHAGRPAAAGTPGLPAAASIAASWVVPPPTMALPTFNNLVLQRHLDLVHAYQLQLLEEDLDWQSKFQGPPPPASEAEVRQSASKPRSAGAPQAHWIGGRTTSRCASSTMSSGFQPPRWAGQMGPSSCHATSAQAVQQLQLAGCSRNGELVNGSLLAGTRRPP